ncbi:hypothetical protein FAP39_05080 [Shimia litoralis]|uniref:Uncharacterized protein n=1 Tax=Shimia litoralis TaxID=420403 RepID=A0A4U7N6H0_9RHOB|nr:hypothetical protein [Shimia litoralis]TKZ21485.1 hypothetical protein FAP39_05080 [Shimia litoralis]
MTALKKYDRLEATALWRPSPQEQRREVIVSIGDATLVISDMNDRALTHWSLPAVARVNPGKRPAIYCPDADPDETLELGEQEEDMVKAIEKLRSEIDRRRPHPGRLRMATLAVSAVSVLALAVFWLPGALLNHTVAVVPDVKRAEIGAALLTQTFRLTGPPCADILATPALRRLSARLDTPQLVIVRGGVRTAKLLPGGAVLMNRAVVEDFEEPDVAAGYVVVQKTDAAQNDPLRALLKASGLSASFRLLTTGSVSEDTLRTYAEILLAAPEPDIDTDALLERFTAERVRSTPFAYALDATGETTLELIEADPFGTGAQPLLSDGDWVALQGICGG